jgi:hypothetical protein
MAAEEAREEAEEAAKVVRMPQNQGDHFGVA